MYLAFWKLHYIAFSYSSYSYLLFIIEKTLCDKLYSFIPGFTVFSRISYKNIIIPFELCKKNWHALHAWCIIFWFYGPDKSNKKWTTFSTSLIALKALISTCIIGYWRILLILFVFPFASSLTNLALISLLKVKLQLLITLMTVL